MKNFVQEFKAFAMRGNVTDLAIAVVIGGAFGKIVSSLVDTVITPMIGLILGGVDFSSLAFSVGDTSIRYGAFIQSVVDFIIIAFVIFLAIRAMNTIQKKEEAAPASPTKPTKEEELLTEIRDLLKK
jgi:large conductance mechanosensitive channel